MVIRQAQSRGFHPAHSAIRASPPRGSLRTLAAAGLIARGTVYGVVGILSLELAVGSGGSTTSQSGAMRTIARQSFGEILLIALAIGLGAYALWRLIEGVAGSRPREDGATQRRVSAIGSAIAYAALCYEAVTILAGAQASGGSPRHPTAGVLGWPGGPVLVAIAGVAVIGVGGYQAYKGLAKRFLEDADTARMSINARRAFTILGVVGHLARAVIFVLIGYGLIKAAVDYSASAAVGLDGALQKLAHASDGPLLLGVVAVGFIAFALFSIIDSRYHRV
jgi:hypothetical protein